MNSGIIKIQYRILNCMDPKPGFNNHMVTFNRNKANDYRKQGFTIQTRQVVFYSTGRIYKQTKWETQENGN